MTELDEIPVSTLANRYGIHRSQVYTRLDALKQRDSNLVPVKRGKKAYITGYMLECLDGMAALVQNGSTTQEAADQVLGKLSSPVVSRPADARHVEESGLAIVGRNEASAPEQSFKELLEVLRGLQEVADNNWWLSTSQLAQVMGLRSLPPGEFERYGFRFVKVGRNGTETAWKIEKIS